MSNNENFIITVSHCIIQCENKKYWLSFATLNEIIKSEEIILTGTFFWVTHTATSSPLQATDVRPPWLIALKAYSAKIELVNNHNLS